MSDGRVFEALRRLLEPRRQVLDDLLVANGELGGSRHGWLLERPAGNTPRDIKWMLKKHAWLVAQGVADWTLHEIHVNRMRQLARDATASTTQGLSRMVEHRRYPLLLAFLRQALIDITDVLMDMFHQCLLDVHGRAKRQMRREDEKRRSARDEIIASFAPLAAAVLNEGAVTAADIQGPVFASVPRAEVERLLELCVGSARPFDTEGLDFLRSRRNHIRQFSKMFLEQMDVRGDAEADPALLHAIEALNIVHSLKGKPLPDDAPMDFVTARWKRFVITSDGIDTAYYELCAMWKLKASLRAGEAWVPNSRRYAPIESYVMPPERWKAVRAPAYELLGAAAAGDVVVESKVTSLCDLAGKLSAALAGDQVSIQDGKLRVPALHARESNDKVEDLKLLVRSRMPRVELYELLAEVDTWTRFSDHLRHELSDGVVPESRKPHIYGAILSSACNVGLGRMAAATRATYSDLQWASSWHLREATVRRAFSVVADFQHRQTLCELWGGTGLSSSDGQRFPVAHRTNVALAQPKYFDVGKGVSIYTALDDRYAQFDAKMIPATAREAAYVLDALVDNETDITLFEHTTDTHGYTDLVFALFELLGYRFSPRLKNIGKWRLYGVRGRKLPFPDDLEVYGSVDPALIVEQWDEMVRIASTIKMGFASASVLISKLQALTTPSPVMKALTALGRICKTEHVLRYCGDESLRRRIGTQLNKGEGTHALRRVLVFGQPAGLQGKGADGLINQVGCLNLLSGATVAWTTVYLAKVLDSLRADGFDVRDEHVARLSPLRSEHIELHGKYRLDSVPAPGSLRPIGNDTALTA
jgi:TnpA family transposase